MRLIRLMAAVGLIRLSLALVRLANRRPRLAGAARWVGYGLVALAGRLQGNPPVLAETALPDGRLDPRA